MTHEHQLLGTAAGISLPAWVPAPVVTAWELLVTYPLLATLVVIVASYLVAKLLEFLLCRGATQLTRRTSTDLDDRVIAGVCRPAFITVFFTGLILATSTLGLPTRLTWALGAILQSFIVLVWFRAAFAACRVVLDTLSRNPQRFRLVEDRTIPLLDITVKLLLVGGAVYFVMLVWNIDPTAWLASAGILGIAVGFAAKDTLANLFAGFFILADAPYKIGDWIILDTGERGRVTQVGIRSTRILTRDDIEITLPNAVIANAKITNESGGPWKNERIRLKVGVAYGSDVDQVCEVLERIAVGHEHVCEDPEPRVRLRGFGDSGIDFELLCWIDDPVKRGLLSHELYMEIYKAFAAAGIEIPYPKRDVYIKQAPSSLAVSPGRPPTSPR